jgi:FtsH-binding integral membrane protein
MSQALPIRKTPLQQRLKPALALGLGLLMLAANAIIVVTQQRFFVQLLYVACALVGAGLFGVVVGEPEDPYGNRPMWFKIGIVASAVVGMLLALVLNIELTVGE